MPEVFPVITIDGPSSSGKGTLSQAMADILQWNLLDSGAIYRALGLLALQRNLNLASEKELVILARNLKIHFFKKKHSEE